ncbi:MAG: hypothetical protein CVU56_07555 [Deltaproteobacteria bacterium HGW-Deltaproteobacteria-14]|nr:MAG: hypothetical protein CVU56_07555 [Deltaproteobacteria bacterium HGW-Deltaproteobacteria-14]
MTGRRGNARMCGALNGPDRGRPLALFISVGLVLCIAAWATPAAAQAPPRVTATVDQGRIALYEELQLSVSLEGSYDEYQVPKMDDFQVVQEGMTQVLTGRRSSVTRNYTLRPKRAGTLQIGPARLTRGGRVVAQSDPLTITVAEPEALAPVTAAEAADLTRHANDGLFLQMATPRSVYYVGEPFPLSLEVYYQVGWQVTGADLVTSPKLDGLLVEDLRSPSRDPQVQRTRVGSTTLNHYPLVQQLATPLRAGRVLIDSATLRLGLSTGLLGASRRYTRSTEPYYIEVREVPPAGRPATFDEGNLGRFDLTASLTDDHGRTPTSVPTGQRMVMRVEVSGTGNLITVKPPRVRASDAFDVQSLPGGVEDEIVKDERGIRGKRTFQYIVTPLSPGAQVAPQVTFAFFDPASGEYVTKEALGGPLEVTGERVTGEKSAAALSGEDVRPIFGVDRARLDAGGREPLSSLPLYWGLLGLPLLGFVLVEARWRLRERDRRHPGQRASRSAHANSKKRLRAAEQAMRDHLVKDFYGQIARTLIGYLEERANIPATGMTHDEVRAAARDAGYPGELADRVIVEMENCDFARFAPHGSASERMRETLDRTSALLGELDRVSPRRRP